MINIRHSYILGLILLMWPISILGTLKKEQLNQLFEIHKTHRQTFFCDQVFKENGDLVLPRCNTCPTSPLKIQWMPIIPLHRLASHLPCYRDKPCMDKHGRLYGGLRCCQKISPHFIEMSTDLFNYVPENPSLIRMKGRYAYADFSNHPVSSSGCHFIIDKKHRQVSPAPPLLGQIARTYLYFHQHYQLPLSHEEKMMYSRWANVHPLSDWERKRSQLIFERQGKHYTYLF
jgi:deoxyribonuclease-1